MTDEAELLQCLRNREKNSIDEAIQIYTPYLSTVLYHMAGNSLPKEDIEEIVADVFVILWKNAERIDLQKDTHVATTSKRNGTSWPYPDWKSETSSTCSSYDTPY